MTSLIRLTLEYLHNHYPKESWTPVYTDGSAEKVVQNGWAEVYIKYPATTEDRISPATGKHSTNNTAEAEVDSTHASHNVVLFTDAGPTVKQDTSHDDLSATLASLCSSHPAVDSLPLQHAWQRPRRRGEKKKIGFWTTLRPSSMHSVTQGRNCVVNSMCCHTGTEVGYHTRYLQLQHYTHQANQSKL